MTIILNMYRYVIKKQTKKHMLRYREPLRVQLSIVCKMLLSNTKLYIF